MNAQDELKLIDTQIKNYRASMARAQANGTAPSAEDEKYLFELRMRRDGIEKAIAQEARAQVALPQPERTEAIYQHDQFRESIRGWNPPARPDREPATVQEMINTGNLKYG